LLWVLVLSLFYVHHHWGVWREHLSASAGHIRPSYLRSFWDSSMCAACVSGNEGGSSPQIRYW
ncbi:hypothetical protein M9458_021821, partial [Cirrhinus mrigala]